MRYKNILVPMGINPHRFKPHIWGAIASGATSLISSFVNSELQKEANQQMIDNQWQMFRAQNERQDYLNDNQDLIKRNSLKRAGMNVNSEFGGYPNLNTNAVSQPQLGASQVDGSTLASLIQQAPLIDAQADKTREEAEALRIENNRSRTEDAQYGIEDMLDYVNEHPDADLPDVEIVPKNAGWFKAHREYNKYKGEQHQVNIAAIEDRIKNAQWAKKSVRDALIDMPYRQLKQVIELTRQAIAETAESKERKELVKAQTAVAELQEKLQQDNNIMPYIDKMFSGEFDFKDACKLLVLAVIGGMSRVSYSASN